jgi:WhiB family redox-sensing transcriptional regulator
MRADVLAGLTQPGAELPALDALVAQRCRANVEPWRAQANCRGIPLDVFFEPEHEATALATCAACSVTDECLGFAVDTGLLEGVYGGTTGAQRRRAKRFVAR